MVYDTEIAGEVAEFLLEIKAVILRPQEPFTWASGWKSPIYCDNRISLSYPQVRSFIAERLADCIRQKFPETEAIAGVATAGIAHAALVGDRLTLPMLYVRSKPKEHGTAKLIEGRLKPGWRVVVVEDLISTGKSSMQAVRALREAGAEVLGLVSVFSYGFAEAENLFREEKVPFYSLSDYANLLSQADNKGYVLPDELKALEQWRQAPAEWGR